MLLNNNNPNKFLDIAIFSLKENSILKLFSLLVGSEVKTYGFISELVKTTKM